MDCYRGRLDVTQDTTALDRLWNRSGARARLAEGTPDEAWMLVHEASPALYLDLLGAVHGAAPVRVRSDEPCRDGRFRRLLKSLGRRRTADSRPDHPRPGADHA